jgi:cell division protein FtsB
VPRKASAVWLTRIGAALAVAVALGWLPYQVYGRSGLARLMKLRAELGALRGESARLRGENARLRAEVALYEEDPERAIERAARDVLGLVKPGEVVFKIEEQK